MTRAPEPPAVGGVPASIAAIMAAIRHEVVAPKAGDGHPVPGVATIDGKLAGPAPHPVAGVAATPALPADVEATVRADLGPLLKAWLDAHLPEIVETAVAAEIRRLTGQA